MTKTTMSLNEWMKYRDVLKKINEAAADTFRDAVFNIHGKWKGVGLGKIPREELIEYAYALATKYGEASAAAAAEMFEKAAFVQGGTAFEAIPAETASFNEVAKTVNGVLKRSQNVNELAGAISRLVKRTGCDTSLQNAARYNKKYKKRRNSGAQFAWIPSGDTCPFCLMLASNGWKNQTIGAEEKHAEHIHANCDCAYMVRFNDSFSVDGYDPEKYQEMFDNVEGDTWEEKVNSMRRQQYEQNKDKINAQKRAAYAERKETILAAQSDGDSVQPLSIKGDFLDFKPLELNQETKSALVDLHNLGKKSNYEYGMAIYEGGKTEPKTDKSHNNVLIEYPKEAKNVQLLHCHTDDSTLSDVDLSAIVKENITSTTVISANYDVWSVNIGNGIRPTKKEFEEASKACYDEAIRTVRDNPDFYNWSAEERYYMMIREKMYRICNYFEWNLSGGNING